MKNFEQRKAAILHRSEVRIRRAKQMRRRILTACVPLVLCVSLWGIYRFQPEPPVIPIETTQLPGSAAGHGEVITGGTISPVSAPSVQINTPSGSTAVAEGAAAERIADVMGTIVSNPEITAAAGSQIPSGSQNPQEDTWRIALEEGNEIRVYLLEGQVLTDTASGQTCLLTESQYTLLLQTLEQLTEPEA